MRTKLWALLDDWQHRLYLRYRWPVLDRFDFICDHYDLSLGLTWEEIRRVGPAR